MLVVGTNSFEYPQKRNFVGLPFEAVAFKKVYDFHKILLHTQYKITGKISQKHLNRFNDLGLNKVAVYHFFNTITPTKKPWIVTAENAIPRGEPNFEEGYKWLAGKYCKAILMLTQYALDQQLEHLNRFPQYKTAITNKMSVLQPAQKVITTENNQVGKELIVTFTGGHFYRKGGLELLKAFVRLSKEGLPLKLNIISALEARNGWLDDFVKPEMEAEVREIIRTCSVITHYPRVPNEKVLEILSQSDIGILPSFGETYGYSILEAMGCGCAVITPNLRPYDEFVKEDWGWKLNVPTKDTRTVDLSHPDYSEILTNEIYEKIKYACAHRDELISKKIHAVKAIAKYHSPKDRAIFIENLYKNANVYAH